MKAPLVGEEATGRSAAILIGGRSRRMGEDKAMVRIMPEDPPMALVVFAAVQTAASDVFFVGPRRPSYQFFPARFVDDDWPEAGSLGGIATAVRHAEFDRCLVVSCDMPFLRPRLLHHMWDQAAGYDVVMPVIRGESRQGVGLIRQTLHAIYGRATLPMMIDAIRDRRLKIIDAVAAARTHLIDEDALRRFDPELECFLNVNTPEALDEARRRRSSVIVDEKGID